MAVVLTAATLLVGAANTAMGDCTTSWSRSAGSAFSRAGWLNARGGGGSGQWPSRSLIPVGIALATHGNVDLLGHVYTFGLLGALKRFRVRQLKSNPLRQERRRGLSFLGSASCRC